MTSSPTTRTNLGFNLYIRQSFSSGLDGLARPQLAGYKWRHLHKLCCISQTLESFKMRRGGLPACSVVVEVCVPARGGGRGCVCPWLGTSKSTTAGLKGWRPSGNEYDASNWNEDNYVVKGVKMLVHKMHQWECFISFQFSSTAFFKRLTYYLFYWSCYYLCWNNDASFDKVEWTKSENNDTYVLFTLCWANHCWKYRSNGFLTGGDYYKQILVKFEQIRELRYLETRLKNSRWESLKRLLRILVVAKLTKQIRTFS